MQTDSSVQDRKRLTALDLIDFGLVFHTNTQPLCVLCHVAVYVLYVNEKKVRTQKLFMKLLHWRSQNAEKVMHIKGRLLDLAVILFHCVLFKMGTYILRKEFALRGSEFFPFRAVLYSKENHLYPLECYYFYYARA